MQHTQAQRSGEYSPPVSGLNLRGRALFLFVLSEELSEERGTWVWTTLRRTGMSRPPGTWYKGCSTPGRLVLSESLSLGTGQTYLRM